MGKKGGKSSGFISQGQRQNVRKDVLKAMRREYASDYLQVIINKREAWAKGKRVMLTVPNSGANNKKTPFIRVKADEVWGHYKDPKNKFTIKGSVDFDATA